MKVLAVFLALGIFGSGCVSMGKYKALKKAAEELEAKLEESASQAKGLESDLGQAKETNLTLSQAKQALEEAKSSLEAKTTELEKATAELSAQKAALEAEKAELLKASNEKQRQYDSLLGDLKKEVAEGQLKITQYQNMLSVDVADKILFDSGKADLKADGRKVLKKVGEALAKTPKMIRVVGHTDNVPIPEGGAYAGNWELSVARATTVVRFLQDQSKLEPSRLVASGRGEWSPVAPNDTPENKQKNRRIEITLVDRAAMEGQAQ